MKNLIDPKTLAKFQMADRSLKDVVEFLDSRQDISTSHFCRLINLDPKKVYNYRSNQKRMNTSGSGRGSSRLELPAVSKPQKRYSGEEKFAFVSHYQQLDSEGQTELLRKYGLYQSDIDRWAEAAVIALGTRKTRSDKKSPEAIELVQVKKELAEMEKTTAKLSTMLVIQKKVSDMLNKKGGD
jgi:transposase-like protein